MNIKKNLVMLLTCLCVILSLSFSSKEAFASSTSYQRVIDKGNVLSTEEIETLNKMCIDYGDKAGIEIYILTHNSSSAKNAEIYIEDFNDTLPDTDRVLLLMDLYNRDVFIEGYGLAETYIHSKRIDQILDAIVPDLSNGDYADAFQSYVLQVASYMEDDTELNYDHDYSYSSDSNQATTQNPLYNIWVQLLISFGVGGIVLGILMYRSSGRMTTNGNTYINQNQSGLIGRRDIYLRTTVTKVRKPEPNNNSKGGFNAGGFRGGTSSGGRSHSSGGRKF